MTTLRAKQGHFHFKTACVTLGLLIDVLMWYPEGNDRSLSVLFNHCTVETLLMRWLKGDMWRTGIAVAGMLLLLVLTVWVPVSAAGAYERASGLAVPITVTVQATPTEDGTVIALNKEKLTQDVVQQQHTWENWLWSNAAALIIVLGGFIGLGRWLGDRHNEREKRVEELFQSAVTGLGDEKEGTKIGAAILLRTFLRPGYERYYTQIFDLVAANLRLPRTTHPLEDLTAPLPLTALSHALIVAFTEAFPLAREQEKKTAGAKRKLAYKEYKVVKSTFGALVTIPLKEIHTLSAITIRLDSGYLWYADLKQVWMAEAFLRKADLMRADLSEANLYGAHLEGAYLWETNLSGANLWAAHLCKADLRKTNLSRAILLETDLSGASLEQVDLRGANLREANLSGAGLEQVDLRGASLEQVDLRGANLSGTTLEDALCLKDTDLRGVNGLTDQQKKAYKAKGAII